MGEFVNSKQVRFDRSHVSCGVMEVHHLPDESASKTLFAICNALYHKANGRPSAFVMFSDTVDVQDSRGLRLAKEIDKTFGGLFASPRTVNPRTGNVICVWMWTIDHDAARKWYVEEYANRVQES